MANYLEWKMTCDIFIQLSGNEYKEMSTTERKKESDDKPWSISPWKATVKAAKKCDLSKNTQSMQL